MKSISNIRQLILVLAGGLALTMAGHVFAAEKYRVSAEFFYLGELIGAPVLDVVEGETAAAGNLKEGESQYKFVVLVRPIAEGQVFVSLSFSSGELEIQPNLLVDIGEPRSATIKKVRLNLLVEKVEET